MATGEAQAVDIFGKPLEITEQEKGVLGDGVRVFLHRVLSVETHTKKGDVSEPKTLVISSSRCHVISHKPSVRLETSFNFLKISLLECSDKKLVFHLIGENKPREFTADRKNGVTIVGLILAQLKNLFPVTPLDSLLKASYSSDSINSEVSLLHESLRQAMESSDPNSLESYITIYGFLCDLHNIPYIPEISSYLRAAYWTHGFRELNLRDFEHISIRDLMPLVSALRHNNYFDSFSVDGMKLTVEVFEELAHTLVQSQTLKKLTLINCGLKPDVLFQYCVAWKTNSKSVLSHIDLSKNQLDEKFIDSFCTGLESLQHGLQSLKLSNCRLSTKVASQIGNAMKQNQDLLYSLTHFDLSENPLGPESQGPLVFLKEPQTVTTLNLSKCSLNFELVFPILIRGCQQHLRDLDLSQNRINIKKTNVTSLAQIMQQFFSSAISLQTINISDCKLTPDLAIAVMEGLSVNPNISDTTLNLSSNELGHGLDVRSMSDSLSRLKRVSTLDISNTNIDQHLSRLIEALGLNRTIKHLRIGQNFEGKEKLEGVKQLCRMIKADDCCLETLDLSDSKLRELTSAILNSLIYNDSIIKLDISGNGMGTPGLRALVKLLLSGTQLQELDCGNNDISATGLTYIADALEHNYTILSFSCPLTDIMRVGAKDGDSIEEALSRIQTYLCRNHSDEKLEMKLAKVRQRTLLTTSQQTALISREVVQVEQMLSTLARAEKKPTGYDTEVARATAVKEEANKVLQLVDSLYSPHKESQQFEVIVNRMSEVLEREIEGLYREFVQENIETMVTQSVKTCPTLLTESNRETLRQIGRRELQSELQETKKAVAKRSSPEIINRISGMNLETAAVISELIVDRTLDELEGCTSRLHSMSERIAGSPSKRVSKIFSFRTKDQTGKRRRRKDDADENEDDIVLPSDPLTTDGPALQHFGNQRPRPPRRHRNHPAGLKKAAETGPASVWDTPTGTDDTDNTTPAALETKKEETQLPVVPILPKVKVDVSSGNDDTKTPTTPSPKDEPVETTPPQPDEATPSSPPPSEDKAEERKPVDSAKKKSGITKFFGSRKDKSKTPPPTSSPAPTPPATPSAESSTPPTNGTPNSSKATSPTHSNENDEGVKKEEEPSKGGEESVDIKRASEIIADEYIVVKTKQPPPAVKAKPQKQLSGESETATTNGTSTGTTTAGTGGWKPPGRAGASVGQLANVLKQGGVPQLKPTKNKEEKEKEEVTSHDGKRSPINPPPIASKPKRPSAKVSGTSLKDDKDSTSDSKSVDGVDKQEDSDDTIEL